MIMVWLQHHRVWQIVINVAASFTPFRRPAFNSSNSGVQAHIDVNIDWKLDELYSHFKTQIEEQGRALDSENLGKVSAT
jgi:hypothetical protein